MSEDSLFGLDPRKLDSVFSIVTQGSDTSSDQKSERLLSEILQKWLRSPICEDSSLLGEVFDTLKHLSYNADSLTDKSMREILLDPDTDIAVLEALRDRSEKLSSSIKSDAESNIAVTIYFAVQASLLVYHDKTSDDIPWDNLSESFGDIFIKKWIPADLKGLFWQAHKICHAKQTSQTTVDSDSDTEINKGGVDLSDKDSISPTMKATDVLLEKPGTHIGRYRLLNVLGEGGMGVVYLAEQERPIKRRVALKVIKPGMDSKRTIEHFEAERQTLALLEHPNIARVFDADTTADGRLYFVMEHVKGLPITIYCEQYELTTEERLGLFLQVCHAIQHAHQKGIIHRDIKPSNILISLQEDQAIPRIIDFGVAKTISQSLTKEVSDPTHGQVAGTPSYMSPEQASAELVDQRTDIWSFGCVLFETLTGTSPFPSRTTSEAIEMVINNEPAWETLPTEVGSDLHNILVKCLKKNLDERYQSASALYNDLHKCYDAITTSVPKPFDAGALLRSLRKPRTAICTLLAALLLSVGIVWLVNRALKVRWVRSDLLPQTIELVKREQYSHAFVLAKQAETYIPNNALLKKLWPEMSAEASITTTPPGASIFMADYRTLGDEWSEPLGQTPLEDIRIPFGVYRVKVTKAGYETKELIARVYDSDTWKLEIEMCESGSHPSEMELIPEKPQWGKFFRLPAYFIDKYEVTNEQFKQFIDEGGYENPYYWRKCRFMDEGGEINWEEAVKRFCDKSGQPGPATWDEGTFPVGQENYPVSGVSWYEAVAYTEFIGKALPTSHHWDAAARIWESQIIIEFSNFGLEGTKAVGSTKAITSTGVYDMAGNVKEWCWNAINDSRLYRYIHGGSWGEPTYMFTLPDSQSAWTREPTIGFRCVFYPDGDGALPKNLFDPIERRAVRDFNDFQPVSENVFASWMTDLYEFDRNDVNVVLDSIDDSSPYWRKEKIIFDAAYDNEQIISYLFLPKGTKPPYQPVIYFPGIGVFNDFSSDLLGDFYPVSLLIKSGRAVLYPVYKGSYERYDKQRPFQLSDKLVFLDYGIKWTKDLRRSVDYLQTRKDLDMNKLTYFGWSVGEGFGPIALVVEDRIKFGIFMHGGLWIQDEFPAAAEPANFAPRVKVPVLLVNGREDFIFPLKLSQEPMYRLLGSADKRHILHPGGHTLFALLGTEIRDEMFAWIDEHLGPVN